MAIIGQQQPVNDTNQKDDDDNIRRCVSQLLLALAPDKVAAIIEIFLDWQPPHWSQLASAVQSADYAVVINEAHLLRGSSATLGARRLAAALERLEATAQAQGALQARWDEAEPLFPPTLAALRARKAELQN